MDLVPSHATALLSPAQLATIMAAHPGLPGDAQRWAPALAQAMHRWGIVSIPARAAFIAICAEETRGFRGGRERLHYSAERLAAVWPRFARPGTRPPEPTEAARALAARGEQAIANAVYAGILGNGDAESGDGWAFRGGGAIQITGKANWRACAAAHGLGDLDDSELSAWADEVAAVPALSAACSAWFFAAHARLLPLVDTGSEADFLKAARRVGLPPDRSVVALWLALWRRGLEVLS